MLAQNDSRDKVDVDNMEEELKSLEVVVEALAYKKHTRYRKGIHKNMTFNSFLLFFKILSFFHFSLF